MELTLAWFMSSTLARTSICCFILLVCLFSAVDINVSWPTRTCRYSGHRHQRSIPMRSHITTLMTTKRCSDRHLKLLILVSSHIAHSYERETVRKTWGNNTKSLGLGNNDTWRVWFLAGQSRNEEHVCNMREEDLQFGDLVQGDFYEDFFNQSLKVEMGLEWANLYCDYKFLLKADEDVYVYMPPLFALLDAPETPRTRLYTGRVLWNATVLREGRYAVSTQEWSETTYPPYLSGGGYLLSRDAVAVVIPLFDVKNPYKIDDVYIGSLVQKAGIEVYRGKHEEQFQMYAWHCWNPRSNFIVQHPVKTRECMWRIHTQSRFYELLYWLEVT